MSDTEEPRAVQDTDKHKPTLKPGAGALRDAWLKSFAKETIIGTIYNEKGAVIVPGKTPIGWLTELQVLDPRKKTYVMSPEELRALWVQIAYNYNRAASMHAHFSLAYKVKESSIEDSESQFILDQNRRWKPGGDMWDEEVKKPKGRPPGKEKLALLAKAHGKEERKVLSSIGAVAFFFRNIMENLETQRRCFKDYAELMRVDPAVRGYGID